VPSNTWQTARVSLGHRLREAKKARRLTGLALAQLVGCDPTAITRWEQDARTPGADYATRLAKALGVSERWLVAGEGPREVQPVVDATPTGIAALELVLFSWTWADMPISVVDEIERVVRAEAAQPAAKTRSASAWRLRLTQLQRDHGVVRQAMRNLR
jgi:transcriptional regulator with XRE-family HTH domain